MPNDEDRQAFHEAAMMLYVTIRPMFTASHDGAPLEIRRQIRAALERAYEAGLTQRDRDAREPR